MLGNNKNPNFVQFVVFGKYDFNAEECDEITFKRGDPILVLEKDDEHKDGWWKGKTADKKIGLFPVEFTTFINIKQINLDGLFEELDSPATNRRDSLKNNTSLVVTNNNIQENNSLNLSSTEAHKKSFTDHNPNNTTNSSGRIDRMSICASPSGGVSPQVIQSPINQMPPHLSIGHPAINSKQKEYQALPPTSWTVDQVIDWLEEIGFGACSKIFKDNNIDGAKLLDQSLATLRELGISQLKDRLKLFNSIVTLKDHYTQLAQEQEMNNSEISRQWEQPSRLYESQYVIEEEREDSVIDDSTSIVSAMSNSTRRNDYINPAIIDNRNNVRQINGPAGMRPRLNSIVSHESLQLTNTNFNYYRSAQRANRAPSQSSKSSISSISSFFRRLSISKPSKKHETVFEPMFQHADYQGWLWTRFNKNSKWKKRWIILSKEKLYFLKEPKHPVNIKHTIPLNITFSIQPDIHKGKTKYTFNLIDSSNQEITYFSADNHLVMMTWINVLVRATTNAASRLAPCPEGKSPIIPPQNIIQNPIPSAGIPPIYGVNASPSMTPSPNPYKHYSIQPQSPQVIRNSGYIHQQRSSIMVPPGVSPRVQHSLVSPHNLPTQVRKSSVGMISPSIPTAQPHIQHSPPQQRLRQNSNSQTPPTDIVVPNTDTGITVENK
jgi:hypothetical protein